MKIEGENPFLIPLRLHTFHDKSSASSRPRQVCLREIVMYPVKLQVIFILVHLPCIYLLHSVQHTALDTTLFPHIPQGLILLSAVAFSVPLTIILVFPIFALIPCLPLHFSTFGTSPLNPPNFLSSVYKNVVQ